MVSPRPRRRALSRLVAALALAAALSACHLIPGLDGFDTMPPAATPPPQPVEPTLPAATGTPPTVPMTPEIPPPIDAPAGAAPGGPLVAGPIAVPDIERGGSGRP